MKKISDIPKRERPREKLQERGAAVLSDLELMAVLVGKGTKGHDVLKISFPPDVLPLIRHYGDRKQEHFIFNQKDYYSFLEKGLL
jgi:DNA repair protein RadC